MITNVYIRLMIGPSKRYRAHEFLLSIRVTHEIYPGRRKTGFSGLT